jgi:hypothetical protein
MIRLRLVPELVFGKRPDRKFDPLYQRRLREAIQALEEDRPLRRVPGPRLDDELRLHLHLDVLEHQGLIVDRGLFGAIYEKTRQQLLSPKVTERMEATCAAWSQPEALAAWDRWNIPLNARASDRTSHEAARAILAVTGSMGGVWVNRGRDLFRSSDLAQETFSQVARSTSRGAALPAGRLPVREYTSVTRAIKRIVDEETPLILQQLCVDVVRTLAAMFPELRIGEWVSIDAQMVAAWTRQESGKIDGKLDPAREEWLTRRCADAGYRAYGYDRDGIGDLEERLTIRDGKFVRGYLQVLITDITTGLPLVGILSNAQTTFEPDTLRGLLLQLCGMWPDIPLRGVIGDKLYDIRDACLTCELDFGVTPVFIRRPSHAEANGATFRLEEHKTISRIDGWGIAYCRKHDLPMRMETLERPSREGLDPGARARPEGLRYRFVCTAPEPCGRASVAVAMNRASGRETNFASALTGLPHHHLSGRPNLFARRQALQAARNSASEAAFSSLLLGYGLGGRDSKRPRLYDREAVETLHWFGFSTRSLLTLLAHREHEDQVHDHLERISPPARGRIR